LGSFSSHQQLALKDEDMMRSNWELRGSSALVAVLVAFLVGFFILVALITGNLQALELSAYDWCTRLLPKIYDANTRIVMITIDENDIRKHGWPLPDAALAKALRVLTNYNALAIGVDIYRDIPIAPGSDELESILTHNAAIVCMMKFGMEGIPPPSILKDTAQVGFNDMIVDADGVVRRALLFLDEGTCATYAFALRLALLYLEPEGILPHPAESNPDYICLGHTSIRPLESNDGGYVGADAAGYQFLIDYKEAPAAFRSYALTDLLAGQVSAESIESKIVILGVTAQDVKDLFYTPYSRKLQADELVYGITLHSHIASQLIRIGLGESRPIETPGSLFVGGWILFWSLTGGAMGLWIRSPWRFSMSLACGLAALCLLVFGAFMAGWWIPVVPPAAGVVASAGLITAYMSNHEKRQRTLLMQIFSRHVSREVAEDIWRQRENFLNGGRPRSQKLIATILFSDLKGFTPVAEKMDPLDLIAWINEYMEIMAHEVERHGGVVDDYAGDGIKANFGVPVARTDEAEIRKDARNAVACALSMAAKMKELNGMWQGKNLPVIGMRIGINTGPVVAGTVGCTQRLKYTTVGNSVNTAARLETYDKDAFGENLAEYPCRILVSEATRTLIEDQFKTIWVGNAKLKGQDKVASIYLVIGSRDDFSQFKQ
jgi:adenylate cyclase